MFNIVSHQRNTDRNYNELQFHTCSNVHNEDDKLNFRRTENNKCYEDCGDHGILIHCWNIK